MKGLELNMRLLVAILVMVIAIAIIFVITVKILKPKQFMQAGYEFCALIMSRLTFFNIGSDVCKIFMEV